MHSIRPKRPGTQMFQRQTSLTKTNFCLFGLHLSACREEISGYWQSCEPSNWGTGAVTWHLRRVGAERAASAIRKRLSQPVIKLVHEISVCHQVFLTCGTYSFFIWINVVRKSYCLPRKQRLLNQEFFVTKALIFLSKDLKNHLAI